MRAFQDAKSGMVLQNKQATGRRYRIAVCKCVFGNIIRRIISKLVQLPAHSKVVTDPSAHSTEKSTTLQNQTMLLLSPYNTTFFEFRLSYTCQTCKRQKVQTSEIVPHKDSVTASGQALAGQEGMWDISEQLAHLPHRRSPDADT